MVKPLVLKMHKEDDPNLGVVRVVDQFVLAVPTSNLPGICGLVGDVLLFMKRGELPKVNFLGFDIWVPGYMPVSKLEEIDGRVVAQFGDGLWKYAYDRDTGKRVGTYHANGVFIESG